MIAADRFWSKVQQREPAECWLWTGKPSGGYGTFTVDGRGVRAHRVAYELNKGAIPAGLMIDHLCRNPICVNPNHLEAVTNRTNVLRGIGLTAEYLRRSHCSQGHEYTPENTRTQRASRVCIECHRRDTRESMRRFRSRKRQLV